VRAALFTRDVDPVGAGEQPLNRSAVAHVDLHASRPLGERRGHSLSALVVHVGNDDRGAPRVQGPGDRLAQTLCRTGHDRGAPLEGHRYFVACRIFCPGTGTILQSRMLETTIDAVCSPE